MSAEKTQCYTRRQRLVVFDLAPWSSAHARPSFHLAHSKRRIAVQVVLIPHSTDGNPYVRELGRAYQSLGWEVVFGAENLLELTIRPRLVHLHWPEAFYRWRKDDTPERQSQRFLDALDEIRRRGAKLVWTVHNIAPHEHSDSGLDKATYQGVIDRADLIVHHCPASITLLGESYRVPRTTPSVIAPHGNYCHSYPPGATREIARRELKIPADAFVYLSFGLIRAYKGLDDLLAAFQRVRVPNKWLVVAGEYHSATTTGALRDKLMFAWTKRVSRRVRLHFRAVPPTQVQSFVNASDCIVLSHRYGLNSGVAILGMTFGKPVVGPNLGCIEWVLRAGRNLVFNAGDRDSLVECMERAATLDLPTVDAANRAVANSWSWTQMAKTVLENAHSEIDPGALRGRLSSATLTRVSHKVDVSNRVSPAPRVPAGRLQT